MRQKKKKEPETGSFIQSEKLEAVTNINQTYEAYTISKVAIGDALGRTRILSKRFNNLEMKLVGALLTLSLLTCTVNFSHTLYHFKFPCEGCLLIYSSEEIMK